MTLPPERQKKLGEDGSPRSAVTRHGAHSERGALRGAPALQDAGGDSEVADLLHRKGQ